MICYDPVVKQIEEECNGKCDDRHEIQSPGVFQDHFHSVRDCGVLVVDLVVPLVQLQRVDGEDDGVLGERAEDHEDAGHDELVYRVQPAGGGEWSLRPHVVENVDDHEKEDDQERHSARNHLDKFP